MKVIEKESNKKNCISSSQLFTSNGVQSCDS
jgi:hypothetical protein